jgi:hypothetical protein
VELVVDCFAVLANPHLAPVVADLAVHYRHFVVVEAAVDADPLVVKWGCGSDLEYWAEAVNAFDLGLDVSESAVVSGAIPRTLFTSLTCHGFVPVFVGTVVALPIPLDCYSWLFYALGHRRRRRRNLLLLELMTIAATRSALRVSIRVNMLAVQTLPDMLTQLTTSALICKIRIGREHASHTMPVVRIGVFQYRLRLIAVPAISTPIIVRILTSPTGPYFAVRVAMRAHAVGVVDAHTTVEAVPVYVVGWLGAEWALFEGVVVPIRADKA